MKQKFAALFCKTLWLGVASAQTIDDGIMMGKRLMCAGYMVTQDTWVIGDN